mmetsp:Transcript_3169/g.5702  ORF Transcript_3169/g.5702 Transcript_3169/m.5702 type:complete len:266 (-) Transcript_3169:7-804(-)
MTTTSTAYGTPAFANAAVATRESEAEMLQDLVALRVQVPEADVPLHLPSCEFEPQGLQIPTHAHIMANAHEVQLAAMAHVIGVQGQAPTSAKSAPELCKLPAKIFNGHEAPVLCIFPFPARVKNNRLGDVADIFPVKQRKDSPRVPRPMPLPMNKVLELLPRHCPIWLKAAPELVPLREHPENEISHHLFGSFILVQQLAHHRSGLNSKLCLFNIWINHGACWCALLDCVCHFTSIATATSPTTSSTPHRLTAPKCHLGAALVRS